VRLVQCEAIGAGAKFHRIPAFIVGPSAFYLTGNLISNNDDRVWDRCARRRSDDTFKVTRSLYKATRYDQ
jgi:hypothetical protein